MATATVLTTALVPNLTVVVATLTAALAAVPATVATTQPDSASKLITIPKCSSGFMALILIGRACANVAITHIPAATGCL